MTGTKKEVAKKVANKSGKVVKTVSGSDDGKALFFLILACSCLYLILDVFYGNNKLLSFAKNIFGITDSSNIVNDPSDLPQSDIKDALTIDKTGQATGNDSTVSGTDGFGGSGGTHNSNGAGAGISGSNSKLTTDGKNGAGLATGATKK